MSPSPEVLRWAAESWKCHASGLCLCAFFGGEGKAGRSFHNLLQILQGTLGLRNVTEENWKGLPANH